MKIFLRILDKNEAADKTETGYFHEVQNEVMTVLNVELNSKKGELVTPLKVCGEIEYMLMVLMGRAGADKSTAVKAAEVFCQ